MRRFTLLAVFFSLSALSVGCADSAGDNPPPGPGGGGGPQVRYRNLLKLKGDFSGGSAEGTAQVVQMAAANGAQALQADELEQGCEADWHPQGSLCDEGKYEDSEAISAKINWRSGATWENTDGDDGNGNPIDGTGILVIDIGSAQDIARFQVFQVLNDQNGRSDLVRFSVHAAEGDTAPNWDDAGWSEITGYEAIGAGSNEGTEAACIDNSFECQKAGTPTTIELDTLARTRYLRVEVRTPNNPWIELRSIKAFGTQTIQ